MAPIRREGRHRLTAMAIETFFTAATTTYPHRTALRQVPNLRPGFAILHTGVVHQDVSTGSLAAITTGHG